MVARLTLSELELNAIGAALDERSQRLSRAMVTLRQQPESPSREYALDCNRMALQQTIRTRLVIAAAIEEPDPEWPADATFQVYEGMDDYGGWTEAEKRLAVGDR